MFYYNTKTMCKAVIVWSLLVCTKLFHWKKNALVHYNISWIITYSGHDIRWSYGVNIKGPFTALKGFENPIVAKNLRKSPSL